MKKGSEEGFNFQFERHTNEFKDISSWRGLKNWLDSQFYNTDEKIRSEEAKAHEIIANK